MHLDTYRYIKIFCEGITDRQNDKIVNFLIEIESPSNNPIEKMSVIHIISHLFIFCNPIYLRMPPILPNGRSGILFFTMV